MDTQINIKGKYALASKIIRGEDFRNNLNYYDLLCLFDSYLKNCDLKDVTRINYLSIACWFFDFLDAEGKVLSQCDIHLCIKFCVLIDNMKSWSAFYKARSKQKFKRLLKWLHDNEMIPFSENTVLPKIIWHKEESLPSFYTAQEVSAMLDAVDISTAKGKEHYLILTLIVYYSLRISDVVYLKLSSIHWKDNEIRLTAFKNGANITLPLIEPVKLSLLDYLMNVRPSDCTLDYVFVTSDPPYRVKEELRTHNYIIKGYLEQAGVDCSNRHHGFHALRHSGATRLLECNTDVETITAILGHSSPNITMAYLTADISVLKDLALEVPYVKKV